jgi:hypothetical protein
MAELGWRVAQLARVPTNATFLRRTRRRQEHSLGVRVRTGLATRWGTAELLREVPFVNEAGELEREIVAYGIPARGRCFRRPFALRLGAAGVFSVPPTVRPSALFATLRSDSMLIDARSSGERSQRRRPTRARCETYLRPR